MRVVVTLCTRQRPRMLRDCLDSLISQRIPDDVSLAIVVVENNESEACRGIVEELAAQPGVPRLTYAHQPHIGIPIARNRALDLALKQNPDWIAFIDDDEVAYPEWIASFAHAAKMLEADVLQGPVERVDAGPDAGRVVRDIHIAADRKRRPTGTRLKVAATNNTMMRASLARADGLGLRFDESLRFTGGSDTEFFARAAKCGVVILWVDEAIVKESVPAERLTLGWQLQRERRVAANSMTLCIRQQGLLYAIGKKGPKCLGRLARVCIEFPVGVALYPFSPRLGSRVIANAVRKLWWIAGSVGAVVGVAPRPYLTVEGH